MSKSIKMKSDTKYLIERAKQNERLAQKELYEAYASSLLSVCRLYINDLHFAEDILLKAFFKIFTHLKDYQEQEHLYAWMRRIVVNEAIDFLRSKSQKVMYLDWENSYDDVEEISCEQLFEQEYLQAFIDELPSGCKMVFNLYVFEEYSHKEIAEELGISEGTSKSQLAYSKKLLREKLTNKKYHYAK
ncbi:RNA polymerase sigma factor [Capnocytophaga cynodegmi]|uniref:Sigma-W factor n=2 Tax=Capnocytophaga cynodegmi TaxID=28189 RepID=A0A0B7HWA6_9FLAO|nr:DNA-directed RNA polymerase sigma-70 factor [Capnocytophaga cynodegmi]CEN34387.1 Sigma-W factor [Capnocytophaga cynodegmi]CEN41793.1 Sigma-W factor [Capnocytophaga cynodegmi]